MFFFFFFYPTEAQFEVSSFSFVPGGRHVKFPSKNIVSLRAFETTLFSSLGIPAGSHGDRA